MPRAAKKTTRKPSRRPSRKPRQFYTKYVKSSQPLISTVMAAVAIAFSSYTLAKVETSPNHPAHAWPAFNAVATGVTATYNLNGGRHAYPAFGFLAGDFGVDRPAKANGQAKGAKAMPTWGGGDAYGLTIPARPAKANGQAKGAISIPVRGDGFAHHVVFGFSGALMPYRTPVSFQLAPNSASNGLSPTLGLGPPVAYVYPMAYAPYGYRPYVMAYAPYGYRAAARPGAMQSGMGAPHAAAAVTCDINYVRAATSSVSDCEKAGGSVIAANAAAQAVQSRN